MSPEAAPKGPRNQAKPENIPSTHAQSVQVFANELGRPDYVPDLDRFDAISLAASGIDIRTITNEKTGEEKTVYADRKGNTIPIADAEKVLDASVESYWHVNEEDAAITDAVAKAARSGSVGELETESPDAYAVFREYCLDRGKSLSIEALDRLNEVRQRQLALSKALEERKTAQEADGDHTARDARIKRISHLVTSVVAADPSAPEHNLSAQMESVAPDGSTHTITLTDRQLEQIEDLSPEIEAGLNLWTKSPEERADEDWLQANQAEIKARNRTSYVLNGTPRPTKDWKPEQSSKHKLREKEFDALTPEQQLGLEPLPNGSALPVPTLETPKLPEPHYGKTVGRRRKTGFWGSIYEFGAALGSHKGHTPREMGELVATGLAGPLIYGPASAVKYATGRQAEEDRNEAARIAKRHDDLKAESQAAKAIRQARANATKGDNNRGYELTKELKDVQQRKTLWDEEREVGKKALHRIMDGDDPTPLLQPLLRKGKDVLPGFDTSRYKRYTKIR